MNATPLANWNGTLMPLNEVKVPVLDRAFLFGDAVYEGLRVYRGKVFLRQEHLARLARSLEAVRIRCDLSRVEGRMIETLEHSGVREGFIYIQITRGEAPRTHYFPDTPPAPNELIYVSDLVNNPYEGLYESGAAVVTVPDLRWKRCDIKSVNLLGNCLAAQAAHEAGCIEAILVAEDGSITEGSHTSLFGVRSGSILTSPLGGHILPGITRGLVLRLAQRADIPVREEPLQRDSLKSIDELFLTGTTAEVLPITTVDGQPVGNGRPGPIVARLRETFREFVQEYLGSQ